MGFLSNFFNKQETETINSEMTLKDLEMYFNKMYGEVSNEKLCSSTYYACMLIRCNAISKLPIYVMKSSDKGSEKKKDHNLFNILHERPNPYNSPHDFKWATEYMRLEYGNAFWAMEYEKGQIKNVYLLDSSRMRIIIDDSYILNGKNSVFYVYNDARAGEIVYTSDEIVHFKHFATDGIKGTSIKKYLGDIVTSEMQADNVIKNRYKTGLQDPIIVEYAGDLDKDKKAKIQKKFETLGGATNAGRVVPIPAEFKVTQLETKLVNNQFFQLQGLTTRRIANAFGVKGFQLNDMEKSTYNNIVEQNKAFYSDTLQNALTVYEQEAKYKMLSSDDKKNGYYIEFNVDAILRSDLKTRYEAYQTGITGSFLTVAEARSKEGLPYIEGTDKLIVGNGAAIPFSQLGNQYKKGGE